MGNPLGGSQQYGQGTLQQAAANHAAYLKALQNASAQGMAKAPPKNEFLESVKKVYRRRAEMAIRFAMGIGGVMLFILSPALGGMLYKFWWWLGVDVVEIRFVGAIIVSSFLAIVGVISVVMALEGSVANRWAHEWVENK